MTYKAKESRYDNMQYNRCGKWGLKLPAVSLGLWHNFGGVDTFENGRQMFRWRESGQSDVINGISITNTIWGHGWNMSGDVDYLVDGFDGMESTNWNVVNTYTTGDFGYAEGKDEIPGFPSVTYPGMATDLWVEPYGFDFNFKDTGFAGKGDSGDPEWRIGL